ncbi:MAG: homoprotocatechuate degradation operon regulator HpaR [Cohaesibacter sp.]|nr:homoprotocatechuate degradation operon regulator HpaR [Cohaesibacter sp.]
MSEKSDRRSGQKDGHVRHTSRALPIALLRARETVMGPIRDMLNENGLTEQKWRILRTLDECGEIEQTQIAREACLLLSSLTRILRSMEADGLISRLPDQKDRRRTLVQITEQGQALLISNMPTSNQIYARIEAHYGREKLEKLLDLLEDLQELKI